MKRRVTYRKAFETPEDLMAAVNEYFREADEEHMPYTISGLCLAIGYSREMLLRRAYDTVVADIILQARQLVEQQHEILLLTDPKRATGVMFALKNLGWTDKNYLDIGIGGSSAPDDKERLKWTIEVIAPGEEGNDNKRKHKIKPPPPELEYSPPAQSIQSGEAEFVPVPVSKGKTVLGSLSAPQAPVPFIIKDAPSMPTVESSTGASLSWAMEEKSKRSEPKEIINSRDGRTEYEIRRDEWLDKRRVEGAPEKILPFRSDLVPLDGKVGVDIPMKGRR